MAEYVDITLEEMDAFLEKAQGFRRLDPSEVNHPCGEHVYELDMNPDYAKGCKIRIYSTISRKGDSRSKGSDAIRVVLGDHQGYPWCKAFKRVHRVKGWRRNVLRRYEPVLDEPWNYRWMEEYPCPKCFGGIMRCRWGKKGSFMGCSNYNPNGSDSCRNTEAVYLEEGEE